MYDFERQSDASAGLPSFEHHAVYMGPWDIMSQHLVQQGQPCPGLSSFTKIRLGWIASDQALLVKPGDTSHAFLSPLARRGETMVVKIPLAAGRYYLVENRQPLGYDRMLPDAGILVLKVDPNAEEGYGTVRVMNADAGAHHFSGATYKLLDEGRGLFVDRPNGLAVVPLWKEGEKVGVLVTTADRGDEALRAARAIVLAMRAEGSPEQGGRLRAAVAAFLSYDFHRSYRIAAGTGSGP